MTRPTVSEAKRLLTAKNKLCSWLAYLVERDGCPEGIDLDELHWALVDAGYRRAAQSLPKPDRNPDCVCEGCSRKGIVPPGMEAPENWSVVGEGLHTLYCPTCYEEWVIAR